MTPVLRLNNAHGSIWRILGKMDTILDTGIRYGNIGMLWTQAVKSLWRFPETYSRRRNEPAVQASPRRSAPDYSWWLHPGLTLAYGNSEARFTSGARWPN